MENIKNIVSKLPKIISFHVGKARMIQHGNKEVPSAIFKQRSEQFHRIHALGVEGDEQGDTINHGGVNKAICVYLQESYKYWEKLGHKLEPGAFGENMMISELTEEEVYIGNTYRISSLVVQVSQPRQPCYKLGIRNAWPELVNLSKQSGYTGFYLRVLEEGEAGAGAELELIEQAQNSMSIKEANHIMYNKLSTIEDLERLAAISELAIEWKDSLAKKIDRLKQ